MSDSRFFWNIRTGLRSDFLRMSGVKLAGIEDNSGKIPRSTRRSIIG